MSKELEEVLMFIQELLNISETEKHFINLANYDTRLNLIKTKQVLQLQSIDNASPNEVLKHFNHFEKWYRKICYRVVTSFELDYDLETIKQYILKKQEQEKVLKIIFGKRVDMWHLVDLLDQSYDMYVAFCKSEKYADDYILTQEEFNSIKEMT